MEYLRFHDIKTGSEAAPTPAHIHAGVANNDLYLRYNVWLVSDVVCAFSIAKETSPLINKSYI